MLVAGVTFGLTHVQHSCAGAHGVRVELRPGLSTNKRLPAQYLTPSDLKRGLGYGGVENPFAFF